MKNYEVDKKYMGFINALFLGIRRELERLYWNKNQKEMVSPFDNTGNATYTNPTFSISAYNWGTEDNELEDTKPNFQYKGFSLWWYKYAGRGMYARCDVPVDPEYLYQMYTDCIESLHKDFGKKYI